MLGLARERAAARAAKTAAAARAATTATTTVKSLKEKIENDIKIIYELYNLYNDFIKKKENFNDLQNKYNNSLSMFDINIDLTQSTPDELNKNNEQKIIAVLCIFIYINLEKNTKYIKYIDYIQKASKLFKLNEQFKLIILEDDYRSKITTDNILSWGDIDDINKNIIIIKKICMSFNTANKANKKNCTIKYENDKIKVDNIPVNDSYKNMKVKYNINVLGKNITIYISIIDIFNWDTYNSTGSFAVFDNDSDSHNVSESYYEHYFRKNNLGKSLLNTLSKISSQNSKNQLQEDTEGNTQQSPAQAVKKLIKNTKYMEERFAPIQESQNQSPVAPSQQDVEQNQTSEPTQSSAAQKAKAQKKSFKTDNFIIEKNNNNNITSVVYNPPPQQDVEQKQTSVPTQSSAAQKVAAAPVAPAAGGASSKSHTRLEKRTIKELKDQIKKRFPKLKGYSADKKTKLISILRGK
jgi:hypothetical protein